MIRVSNRKGDLYDLSMLAGIAVKHKIVDRSKAETDLERVAFRFGLQSTDYKKTIRNGMEHGIRF